MQVALRTQQIIAHESGVTNTIDPVAGSYYVENLTDEIESGAMDYIDKIEETGRRAASHRARIHDPRDSGERLEVPATS